MKNVCENCKYWAFTDSNLGECRKNPPLLAVGMISKDQEYEKREWAVWPSTHAEDWCGEWATIKPQQDTVSVPEKPRPEFGTIYKLLDNRSWNVLRRNGITTWEEFLNAEFQYLRGCGPHTRRSLAKFSQTVLGVVPVHLRQYAD